MMGKSTIEARRNFAIGTIFVVPSRNILKNESDVYPIEPRIMDVLEYLAVNQGRVCSRDEIIEAIWKVEFGADESLTRAISIIRKTFRKAGGRGQYIQTVSKRGYCLQESIAQTKASNIIQNGLEKLPEGKSSSFLTTSFIVEQENNNSLAGLAKKLKISTVSIIIVMAILIGIVGITWHSQQETFGQGVKISPYGRSVAVMPFVDMSIEQDHQYFSDGMAEELLNEIGKISSLRVVGPRLGGENNYKDLSYHDIGDKLKVAHIIHGSVRKQGDIVRITARMINTEDNSRAWSSNYDGTLENIIELQQRVSFDIVTELTLLLSLEIEEPIYLEEFSPTTLSPEIK